MSEENKSELEIKNEIRKEKILDVIRIKKIYRGKNIYINFSHHNYEMIEMFVKFAIEGEMDNQYMEAGWDALTRMISVSPVPVEVICKQMQRASRTKDDLPALVNEALNEFSVEMDRRRGKNS